MWARRCCHEASAWDHNAFITLTYSDDHVPKNGFLEPAAFTRFVKRLRKAASQPSSGIDRNGGSGIRYFGCGEYGELQGRPHYHALLFNCGFADQKRVGKDLFESEVLGALWPFGKHAIGKVTAASAAYIAQYSLKKLGTDYGEAPPPFLRMSLKPGIGSTWLDQFAGDLKEGYLVADGKRGAIPRAYVERLKRRDALLAEGIEYKKYLHRWNLASDPDEPRETMSRLDYRRARLAAAETIHERRKELTECRSL